MPSVYSQASFPPTRLGDNKLVYLGQPTQSVGWPFSGTDLAISTDHAILDTDERYVLAAKRSCTLQENGYNGSTHATN